MTKIKFSSISFKNIVILCGFFGIVNASQPLSIVGNKADQIVQHGKSFLSSLHDGGQVPVESGIYFQRAVALYKSRIRRDVITAIKREADSGDAQAKELLYLFDSLITVVRPHQAVTKLSRALSVHKTMVRERADLVYRNDRAYAAILLQGCVTLTDVMREQLLAILDEVSSSLTYWKEQKNRPMSYFFHKSPLKWVMGKSQSEEIANNIKVLEKLESKTRIVLGKMTKHVYAFDPSSTLNDIYAWVKELLSIVVVIGKYDKKDDADDTTFDELAAHLQFDLSNVLNLKKTIMSKMSFAKKPSHMVRHWMAYTAAALSLYGANKFYSNEENAQWINDLVGPQALLGYAKNAVAYVKEEVVDRMKNTFDIVFVGATVESRDIEVTRKEMKNVLEKIRMDVPGWVWGSLGGKLVEGSVLSDEDIKYIMEQEARGNIAPYLDFFYKIRKDKTALAYYPEELIRAGLVYVNLLAYHILNQFGVIKNIALAGPGILGISALGYSAKKTYDWFKEEDYSEVRLALVQINSLFIESVSPLNDLLYGKLIYLLNGIKEKAVKYLPVKDNMRSDFLADVIKLESQQFTVETKRRIIKNMFLKYPFLKFNAKSA